MRTIHKKNIGVYHNTVKTIYVCIKMFSIIVLESRTKTERFEEGAE